MNQWINQMYAAKIVKRYGIVRRKNADVNKYASFDQLLRSVKDKDYHLIETGDQFIVICNPGVLKIHC